MPLYEKVRANEFVPSSDDEIVGEERLLIEGLHGIKSYFASDHILNLLEEVEGQMPGDKAKMTGVIDRYLTLPEDERLNYRLGRRAGVYRKLDDLNNPALFQRVQDFLEKIGIASPQTVEETIASFMGNLERSEYFLDVELIQSLQHIQGSLKFEKFDITCNAVFPKKK